MHNIKQLVAKVFNMTIITNAHKRLKYQYIGYMLDIYLYATHTSSSVQKWWLNLLWRSMKVTCNNTIKDITQSGHWMKKNFSCLIDPNCKCTPYYHITSEIRWNSLFTQCTLFDALSLHKTNSVIVMKCGILKHNANICLFVSSEVSRLK